MNGRTLQRIIWVEVDLRAFHTDPHRGEGRHAHVWTIRLYYEADPFKDLRDLEEELVAYLAPFQDRDLHPRLWAVEDLGAEILGFVRQAVGITLTREDHKGAELWWN